MGLWGKFAVSSRATSSAYPLGRYRAAAGYSNDFSYTSHSHGWSTGPTPALTFHVVGLTLTSPQGATWSIAPIPSGLDSAEGGFETGLGWFGVKWNATGDDFFMEIETPEGTSGMVVIPSSNEVTVDGEPVISSFTEDSRREIELSGGTHVVIA